MQSYDKESNQLASNWKSGARHVDYQDHGEDWQRGMGYFFDCDKIVNGQFFILTKRLAIITYLLTYLLTP